MTMRDILNSFGRMTGALVGAACALSVVTWSASVARANDDLTIVLPVKTVSFAPIFLAIDGGHFAKQNITMEVVVVRGGSPAIAALIAGDAQFISVADDELLKVAKSEKVIRVHTYSNSFTQNLQVRNAILEERKISTSMPVMERVKRLKGITIGVIIPGGSSDLAGRWLFQQAGLDPVNDMKVLRIGGLPALVASLKAGNIDAFVLSAPAGPIVEAQGIGKILVQYDEIPEFAAEPFLGIETRPDYLAENREVVLRVVRAVAAAQAEIHKDPAAAAKILSGGSFSSVRLPTLVRSLEIMQKAYRAEKMTAARWEFVKTLRIGLGRKEFAGIEMKEGVHWTNLLNPQ